MTTAKKPRAKMPVIPWEKYPKARWATWDLNWPDRAWLWPTKPLIQSTFWGGPKSIVVVGATMPGTDWRKSLIAWPKERKAKRLKPLGMVAAGNAYFRAPHPTPLTAREIFNAGFRSAKGAK